jgi:asparagine synthase (glutamine-hydrolysing)
MCGIAGYISTHGTEVPADLIQRMTDAVAHRGPDGEGVWRSGPVAFGHRRLSILDLSEQGHQPMVDAGAGNVITFNGEIYNYVEIRQTLLEQGYRFRSHSDTEVILKAYDFWGERCVERFNGMWAFAIYDPRRNVVFCSRDRFGVKPFYYTETAQAFAFGSEIRQLLPLLPGVQADMGVLVGFLDARVAEHPERTFFADVRKLPGGHNLVFDLATRQYTVQRHYGLSRREEYAALDEGQALERFDALFDDAIRLRLRSDVQVGTCLSGGMDSSSIATRAAESYRRASQQDFSAITAISEDRATDESEFARLVVEASRLKWLTVKPGYEDFRAAIDAVVRAQEEPFASASVFMQYFVMREARRVGIPVLLDGQGGDETLLGYDRYFADHLLQSLRHFRVKQAGAVVSGLVRNGRPGALRALVWNLMYFHAPWLRRLATRGQRALLHPRWRALAAGAEGEGQADGDLFALQKREIERTNLPALLRYEDKNSMAHSIETRLPFLDYRVVELATALPVDVKLREGWGKYLLRKAMDVRMPASIVWRKHKFGFEAPEARWMRLHEDSIRETIASSHLLRELFLPQALEEQALRKLKQGLLWRLYSVALWEREFGVVSAG